MDTQIKVVITLLIITLGGVIWDWLRTGSKISWVFVCVCISLAVVAGGISAAQDYHSNIVMTILSR